MWQSCDNNMFRVMETIVYQLLKASINYKQMERQEDGAATVTERVTGTMPVVDEIHPEMLKALNVVSLSHLTHLLDSIHRWQLGLRPQVKEFNYLWALFLNEGTT